MRDGMDRIEAIQRKVDEADEKDKKSTSTTLVEIALDRYSFGVSTTGETFALPKHGNKVVSMLRGSKTSLRGVLAREYFRVWKKAAPQQALADCMLVLEGMAQESDEVELHLRVARHDGSLWLDIGDQTGRAIRVSERGWSIEPAAPVFFKRTILTGALPEPERGADLGILWRWLNVAEPDRPLVASWLVASLYPEIPHPVLAFFGEQGTGKTTAQKMLVSAIDPGPVPTRKPPRDAESWVTAAAGSWVVGLDNLSDVPH
ncbi:MAG TPA: ATP-binding protein, partial [Gammaproteobacteria bacterium]